MCITNSNQFVKEEKKTKARKDQNKFSPHESKGSLFLRAEKKTLQPLAGTGKYYLWLEKVCAVLSEANLAQVLPKWLRTKIH